MPVTSPSATIRRPVFVEQNYTLTDDIHFLLGRHNIDAGYHGEVSKIDMNNHFEQPGEFYFNSDITGDDPAANFLFGNLYHLSRLRASTSIFAASSRARTFRTVGRRRAI